MDLAVMRDLPNMTVIAPSDSAQCIKAIRATLEYPGPVCFRIARGAEPAVYTTQDYDYEVGKAITALDGTDLTIIATDSLVALSISAANGLAKEGISVRVIDMFTWKPLDEQLILDSAAECGAIVTAENHQVKVGLGSAVANVVIKNNPVPLALVGVEDRFGQVGAESFLREEDGLTAAHIVEAAKKAIDRKNG